MSRPTIKKRIARFRRKLLSSIFRWGQIPNTQTIESSGYGKFHVDHAYALDNGDVIIFGWQHFYNEMPTSIEVFGRNGKTLDLTEKLISYVREDVWTSHHQELSGLKRESGYCLLMRADEYEASELKLRICFAGGKYFTINVPFSPLQKQGVELAKAILSSIHSPDEILYKLYEVFDSGFGSAINSVLATKKIDSQSVKVEQFGTPCSGAEISVIIPLYGRCDFLRHQLAQFADDESFSPVDLIYVVDDPLIYRQTRKLACKYESLFGVSFKLVYYECNIGFAGASNIGASLAEAEYLVMMNSDVIPKHPGWFNLLKEGLDSLPDAGAVAPLLQFYDDSIQHAGMYPYTSNLLPGFLLNKHKNMGGAWSGPDEITEHPMLTAACLMMRTETFRELGGFDEGYLTGDFEDSDLCMALRKSGRRLYLIPKAKLWHLERQSQAIGSNNNMRMLTTLFNSWRYTDKIHKGEIADPRSKEATI